MVPVLEVGDGAAGRLADRQVTLVFTGDEEDTGKPYEVSRAALFEAASRSDVALAFEGEGGRWIAAWTTGEPHEVEVEGRVVTLTSRPVYLAA